MGIGQWAFAWAARDSTSSPESRYGSMEGDRIYTYTSEDFPSVNSWVPVSSLEPAREESRSGGVGTVVRRLGNGQSSLSLSHPRVFSR